ncbi:hypothetical protein SAMN05444369_1132 [Capnocytophaga haemolytica]|uniref:Uncharacterized protein n=1 Tax=Capnocytophaga haemolytica TaxID=45243 RepID=A0AAX2GX24_9FLAO|nr:hypothetical protein SAMN05444369_1132 [Capnocytophaga haemolytica]SNV08130.1 Uncharacterised protein [Capnocytophaga haemolytica]
MTNDQWLIVDYTLEALPLLRIRLHITFLSKRKWHINQSSIILMCNLG